MNQHPSGEDDGYLSALLDTMVERRASVDRAEADLLAMVVDYADACPTDGDDTLLDGPPAVAAETAIVELGARLGISYRSAGNLLTEAVQLRDRLPRLWDLVHHGRLQAWKARQVARVTIALSDAAAQFIDAHAAVSGYRNQLPDLRKLVIIAINRCDPDLAEGLEEAALAQRDVEFSYSTSTDTTATARLEATLDLLDALDLDATVTQLATHMGHLGDHTPLGVRRAHALGTLANPQRTLDLFGDPATPTLHEAALVVGADPAADDRVDSDVRDGLPAEGPGTEAAGECRTSAPSAPAKLGARNRSRAGMPWDGQRLWNSQVGHLYLHLDAADLRALLADGLLGDRAGGVDLEQLGAASLALVHDWLGRVTRISLRPVLDMTGDDPVDRHDPSETMREHVILRDGHCVFPGCHVGARGCDLDHIDPYIPIDHGGPPGQTSAANLACLCRRHHRMKTHHDWHYQRTRDGTYHWTDPHGTTYTTAPVPIHPARPHAA